MKTHYIYSFAPYGEEITFRFPRLADAKDDAQKRMRQGDRIDIYRVQRPETQKDAEKLGVFRDDWDGYEDVCRAGYLQANDFCPLYISWVQD